MNDHATGKMEFWAKIAVSLAMLLSASVGVNVTLLASGSSYQADRMAISNAIQAQAELTKQLEKNQHADEIKGQQMEDHLDNLDARLNGALQELSALDGKPHR